MRSQIPIIIAVILLLALAVSTIYYTTSMLTYTSVVRFEREDVSQWSYIEEQITSIILSSLASASVNASQGFKSHYWSSYKDSVVETGSWQRTCVLINNENCATCGKLTNNKKYCTASWISYNYDDFRCPGLCGSNYTSAGINWALANYTNILMDSAQVYAGLLGQIVSNYLDNWARIMNKYGLSIYAKSINVSYNITVTSKPGDYNTSCSTSQSKLRVSVSLDAYSIYAGYRRINNYVEIAYNSTFCMGLWSNDGMILPVYLTAYVDLNGQKGVYIIDPDKTSLTIYSVMLKRLSFLNTNNGNITLKPYASYYINNGTVLLYFKIPAKITDFWKQEEIIWNTTVLSCVYCDDTFPPPFTTKDDKCTQKLTKVTVAFLLAGLVETNINGLTVFNGLKIILKHYANTEYNDWLDSIPFDLYGDEKASFPQFIS
ncbi:MAG: hypothetical protein QXP97_06035 [Desulfurococcus sp.]|uniref:hypothetical protein n=1 Tax=Desulfurococcus sp. TaxID=51678 RepID=UPI003162F7D0